MFPSLLYSNIYIIVLAIYFYVSNIYVHKTLYKKYIINPVKQTVHTHIFNKQT